MSIIPNGANVNSIWNTNGWNCSSCGNWVGSYEQHLCNGFRPYLGTTLFKTKLSEYSLQELLDELKVRKNAQDVKVKELEKEVELQKQLDAMFPENKSS